MFAKAWERLVQINRETDDLLVVGLVYGLAGFAGWEIGVGLAYLILTFGLALVAIGVAAVGAIAWLAIHHTRKHGIPAGNGG